MWNRLPESLKVIQSAPIFKSNLMVFLLTTVWTDSSVFIDPSAYWCFRKEIYIHKIITSNSNINVYRTFNNNVIIHKTQNKLPKPKYSATEISISIASSRTFVKTMVTLGNQVGSNPGKRIQMKSITSFISSSRQSYQFLRILDREASGRHCIAGNHSLSDLTQVTAGSSPCLSIQLNEHLWAQVLKHLNVHIYLVSIVYRYYNQLISRFH